MSRRSPLVAAAVAAALGLAACSGDGDAAADAPDTVDQTDDAATAADPDLPAAGSDLAGTTAILGSVDLTPVTAGQGTGAHAPGLALEVTAVGQVPTIPADVYEDITGDRVETEEDDQPATEVRPADGHVFVVATYETRDPEWRPRGNEPRTTGTLRVQGSDVEELFRTDDGSRHTGTVVVSLPEGHAPDDAVIELETDGAFQTVSLLDGKRLRSDVEHAYPGPQEVTVVSAERLDASFDHWIAGDASMQGEVVGAYATPYMDEGYGQGDGWASPGQQYLAVEVDWHSTESLTWAEIITRAETPDGEVYQPINDPSSLTDAFAAPAVFQLPVDVDEVTIVIESSYQNGAGRNSPIVEFDAISAELRIG